MESSLPGPKRETDWGVELPGELLPPEQWTQTRLDRLPLGRGDLPEVFGRQAPLVIDLGCGNGRFIIRSALSRPEFNHWGIDLFSGAIRHAVRRANRRGLRHVRFSVGDAADLVQRILPDQSVHEVHLYHPQPVYDLAEASRRLVTPAFLLHVYRVLQPEGLFVIQTDHPAYWQYLRGVIPWFFLLQEPTQAWLDAPEGRTRREILARRLELPVFRGMCTPLSGLDPQEARRRADQLPLPSFNADRRWLQADACEKEAPMEDDATINTDGATPHGSDGARGEL